MHMDHEGEAEKLRLRLGCIPNLNMYQLFNMVDLDGDGFVDKEDVSKANLTPTQIKELLARYQVFVSELEIFALIDRYDRKKDSKISYSEVSASPLTL